MNNINRYYEILGINPGASLAEVKQAYKDLATVWHPDRFTNNPRLQEKAEKELKKINEAYQYLKSYQPSPSPFPSSQAKSHSSPQKADVEIYYKQGMENAQRGKYQQAIKDFSQAIRLDSNYIKAYKYRGIAYAKLGNKDLAAADLQVAAKFHQQRGNRQDYQDLINRINQLENRSATNRSTPNWHFTHTLAGHDKVVESFVISPNGQFLASGSWDKTIKLWNLKTGQAFRTIRVHTALVLAVAISPDGQILASGGSDSTIKLWNLKKGRQLNTFRGHAHRVNSVALSIDGEIVASGSLDKTVKLWSLKTGQETNTLTGHRGEVNCVALSLDGEVLASGSADGTVKIWQPKEGREICTLTGHRGEVNAVALNLDGATLASGSADGKVKLWSIREKRELYSLTGHGKKISTVALSIDGRILASGSRESTIKIWRFESPNK